MSKRDLVAPPVSLEVIQWLERLFPDRLPNDVPASVNEVCASVGEQRVIRRLRKEYAEQNKPTSTGVTVTNGS